MKRWINILFLGCISLGAQSLPNTHDLKGKVKSCEHTTFKITDNQKDNNPIYHTKTKINLNNLIAEVEKFTDGKSQSIDVFEYNGLQQLESVETLQKGGKIDKATLFFYDDKGQLSDEKKFNNQNTLEQQITYIYNNNMLTNKITRFIKIGHIVKETYLYDSNNRIKQINKEAANGVVTQESFFYDTQGKMLKKTMFDNSGKVFSEVVYDYNEQSDKEYLYQFDADGNLTTDENYEYQYDEEGNWIKKTSYIKGIQISEETRIIMYY